MFDAILVTGWKCFFLQIASKKYHTNRREGQGAELLSRADMTHTGDYQ